MPSVSTSRRDEVLVTHRDAIRAAAERAKARSIALVGSVARGEDGEYSDVDFLVDFEPEALHLDALGLVMDLERLLGLRTVDVISVAALTDWDYDDIVVDAICLWAATDPPSQLGHPMRTADEYLSDTAVEQHPLPAGACR